VSSIAVVYLQFRMQTLSRSRTLV